MAGIITGNAYPLLPFGIFAAGSLIVLVLLSLFLLNLNPLVLGISFTAMVWGFFSITQILSPNAARDCVSRFADSSPYTISGKIVSFSKDYSRRRRVLLSCDLLERKGMPPVRVRGRIILNIYDQSPTLFRYGDVIEFISPLKPIRNFSNPGGFDYERQMKFDGVFGSGYAGAHRIRVIRRPTDFYSKSMRYLEQLRNRFYYFTRDRMENKDAWAILTALVTGKKEAVPLKLKDLFSKAGASHILAISGLHLSIVALGFFFVFYTFLSRFSLFLITGFARKTAGILTLFPLFVYGLFSGFSPSTQRAFIMTCVFMVSFLGERENTVLNTLALAAVVILIHDTSALFSISFQLSFGALLFIILGFSLIRVRGWIPQKKSLKAGATAVLITFFAGLGTFPLTAHYFHLVSHVQVLSNLVLVPLMGFVCLPLGFLILLSIPTFPVLAGILATLCQRILSFCIGYIEFLTSWKYSWSRIGALNTVEVIWIYFFLATVGVYAYRQKKTDLVMVAAAVLTGVFCFGTGLKTSSFPEKMSITILDVGQGNSALVQTIEGKNILVDGGGFSGGTFDVGRYVVAPFLWYKKILSLDAVILTHPEADHMNGLLYVLENFKIHLVVKNRDKGSSSAYGEMIALCRAKKIKIWTPPPGDAALDFGGTDLVFYNTTPAGYGLNNNSLVFRLHFRQFSMLFPGDILRERETLLVHQKAALLSKLLLSPHHGSFTSHNEIFLDKVNPESVIISCGYKNRYGFPHPDVLEGYEKRGFQVFRTDLDGAVTISSDGIGYNILTHKGG